MTYVWLRAVGLSVLGLSRSGREERDGRACGGAGSEPSVAGDDGGRCQGGGDDRTKCEPGTCIAGHGEGVATCNVVVSVASEEHDEQEAATYPFGRCRRQ